MHADVSVVICTHTAERWAALQRAVRSVIEQTLPVREVIVVVDHEPTLLDRARSLWCGGAVASQRGTFSPVRVVENRSARGLSGARNTGAFAASGEIVAFLDDDALADTGWMKRLTAGYDADDVVAYGGIVLPMIAGRRPDWWPIEFDWVIGCSYTGLPSGPSHIRNLIGANMSVRRQALLDLNGFRSDVGRIGSDRFGCEETEFFIRLTQDRPDARIVYDPTVVVRHEVPAKRLSWRYFSSRCYAEGRSKAAVSRSVGSKSALASERSYLLKVLPRAMASGLLRAARRERGAAQRTLAIAAGALITAAGYVRGRVAMARWQAST